MSSVLARPGTPPAGSVPEEHRDQDLLDDLLLADDDLRELLVDRAMGFSQSFDCLQV